MLGLCGCLGLARAVAAGLGRCGPERGALGSGQRESLGRAGRREGTGDPEPFFSTGSGERPCPRRVPVKFSALFYRTDWRSAPLSFCPRAAGGLGSPSADSEMALARVGGSGKWERGVGALGLRTPPNRVGTAWASGGSAASGRRRVRASLSGFGLLTAPSTCPLANTQGILPSGQLPPLDRSSSPTWVPVGLSEATPRGASCRSARALLLRGEGFGRVSMKNNLWRPPALALCT